MAASLPSPSASDRRWVSLLVLCVSTLAVAGCPADVSLSVEEGGLADSLVFQVLNAAGSERGARVGVFTVVGCERGGSEVTWSIRHDGLLMPRIEVIRYGLLPEGFVEVNEVVPLVRGACYEAFASGQSVRFLIDEEGRVRAVD